MSERLQRSYRIHPECKEMVDRAVERHGFSSQKAWAESLSVGLTTVKVFLRGDKVSKENFLLFCDSLGLDWQLAHFGPKENSSLKNAEERIEPVETEGKDTPDVDSEQENTLNKQGQTVVNNDGHGNITVTGKDATVLTARDINNVNLYS